MADMRYHRFTAKAMARKAAKAQRPSDKYQCVECDHTFKASNGSLRSGVRCPKCHSYDVEPA